MVTRTPVGMPYDACAVEVHIHQARDRARRRRWQTVLAAIGFALVLGATAIAVRTWVTTGPLATHRAGPVPSGLGRTGGVTGYIQPCVGIAATLPPYPGGTVTALRGFERMRQVGPGAFRPVLPRTVVATDHVGAGQRFAFRLAPGHYVLLAHSDQGVTSSLGVSVKAGLVSRANMPDVCK